MGAVAIPTVLQLGEELTDIFDKAAKTVALASINIASSPYDPNAFVFEVSTATGAIFPSAGGTIQIDWGDETANSTCTTTYVIVPNNTLTCDYPEAGTYQIAITGDMAGYGQPYISDHKSRITKMIQWGNTGLTDLSYALYGANNVTSVPSNLPSSVQYIDEMFAYATALNDPSISDWETQNVKTMPGVFRGATSFNQPLGSWDISSVSTMMNLFRNATEFNQDISSWDVSNVENFTRIFRDAVRFDQDLSGWDVSSGVEFVGAFNGASNIAFDPSSWDVSSATNLSHMFYLSTNVYGDLSGWCVNNIPTRPEHFSTNTAITVEPVWGTCP